MSAKPHYFRIGLFIALGLAILAGSLIAFGAGQVFRPRIYFETYVDGTVQGVDVGTPVKFRGVQIGKVSAIKFTFNVYGARTEVDRYNYVLIVMDIDTEIFPGMFHENLTSLIEKNVAQGLRARIEPLGITGMNYIEINYVNDPAQFPSLAVDWTPHFYYIPSAPGQFTNILDSINNMMRQLEQFNLGSMSEKGMNLLEELNKAVTQAEIGKVSADLQSLLVDFKSALNAANLGGLSADAKHLMAGLEKSNSELRVVLKNLEPATKINEGQVRAMISNLAATSANLEQITAEVKRRPSLMLWGSPPQEKPAQPRRR